MEKIKVTQQQRDNALEALNVMWPSVPPENVAEDLQQWHRGWSRKRGEFSCGTVACFGGWCAAWPGFRDQGVLPHRMTGEPSYRNSESYATSEYLFGHKGMFLWRGPFPSDDFFNGTDHALVTNRLRWLIKNSTVVEPNKPRKTASGS